MLSIELPKNKKIYFASDNHLGAPTVAESKPREAKFVQWLDTIKADAGAIFLLGDLFDFWFEYKKVVPKGFVRTSGKLAPIDESRTKPLMAGVEGMSAPSVFQYQGMALAGQLTPLKKSMGTEVKTMIKMMLSR